MKPRNLLVIAPEFPDESNKRIGGIFVKEQINYIKEHFDNVYVVAPNTIWKRYLAEERFDDYSWSNVHVYYPMMINWPFPYTPKHLRYIWLRVEKFQVFMFLKYKNIYFDLIHAHFTWYPGALAALLKKNFNVPVIITEHTSTTFSKAIREKDSLFIESWMKCDGIIRVRKKDLLFFKYVGIPLEKIHCIPNGFDGKKFAKLDVDWCRKELNLPLDKKILLSIGNLVEVKGHKFLVESMAYISKCRDDVICIIIGEGKLKAELDNLIKLYNLDKLVILVGGKPHDEIPLWINACDVFVLPSLNEGNPTVMFECLGCGKPFVGTAVGGIPEIIISENYGHLTDPKNPEKLAKVILLSLDKDWNGKKISDYAKQFDWSEIAKKIVCVYDSVTEKF